MKNFIKEIVEMVRAEADLSAKEIERMLQAPPDPELGDYALPCFVLAKKLKKSPAAIAEELAKKLQPTPLITEIRSAGPYLNFVADKAKLMEAVLSAVLDQSDSFGTSDEGKGKSVVIDYSSPNIAKPFGIAHLRSTVIGNAIYKLHQAMGYDCVRINHLGDWGTQFGKIIVAYRKWGKEDLGDSPVERLQELYIKFTSEVEQDASLDDEARDTFRRLEAGDEEILKLWESFRALSIAEFERVYRRLGVSFDSYAGESFYRDKVDDAVELIEKAGLAKTSEDALIVDLEEYNMPPCLIRKRDESTLYATRDIAAALYRRNEYDFTKLIYVVGADQKLHFRQVFKVLELMGCEWAKQCTHVDFGMIRFKGGKLSTRAGKVILLEEVLNRAVELVSSVIEEKNPDLVDKEQAAEAIGIGAVIFADLRSKRIKDVDFDWDEILSFEGETGPYVQYTHVRLCSVLRKFGKEINRAIDFAALRETEELQLVRLMEDYPNRVRRAADACEPSIIAMYLLELCSAFNRFYHNHRILADDDGVRDARLLLVDCLRQVIRNGLEILGITALEEM